MPETAPSSSRRTALGSAAIAVLLAVVAVVVLRPGDDDRPAAPAPTPTAAPTTPPPPLVEATWTSTDAITSEEAGVLPELSGPDRTVVTDGTDIVALDSTGARLWTLPDTGLCRASGTDGDQVAVVVVPPGAQRCTGVGLLDLAAGRLVWQRTIPDADPGERAVGLSRDVVTASASCTRKGSLSRFDRSTGRPVDDVAPAPAPAPCEGAGVTDDRLVLPVAGPTRRPESLVLADPDSGRTTARVAGFDGPVGTTVYSVVSRDPLVVDVERRGHRLLLLVDDDGGARPLGYQQDSNPNGVHRLVGIADGVLVATFQYLDTTTYGIDLATGDVLWAQGGTDPHQVAGTAGDRLVSWYDMGEEVWLTATDLRTGTQSVLGRIAAEPTEPRGLAQVDQVRPVRVVGDQVVVTTPSGVRSYPVPAEGDGVERDRITTTTFLEQQLAAGSEPTPTPSPDPDDHLPGDGAGCDDVSPAAFRELGWGDDADLPRPATCSWVHLATTPRGRTAWFSDVAADTYVATPAQAERIGATSATAVSEDQARRWRAERDDAVAVPGVGEEAFVSRIRRGGGPTVEVIVRDRNLTATVSVRVSRDRAAPDAATVDRAALALLRDLLTPYGITPPTSLPASRPAAR